MLATDYVGFHARIRPNKIAVVDLKAGINWSYSALNNSVSSVVTALSQRGVTQGDRVAVLANNTPDIIILHIACARLGAIFVPLNWRLSPSELAILLADAEPSLVLGDAFLDQKNISGESLSAFLSKAQSLKPSPLRLIDPDNPSLILYTSGTSGLPKGVLLTERNINETAINFSLLGNVAENSVFLCDSPMFHTIGLISNFRPALMRGGTILVSEGFDPSRTLTRLGDKSLNVTHYFCVPQMAESMRAASNFDPNLLGSLVAVFTGGAPHPAANIRKWLSDGIPIVDGYGMTESGTVFGMALGLEDIEPKAGSVGLSTPRVQTRIVDENLQDVEDGGLGELLIKGAGVFGQYWRKREETMEAFTKDGWFRTGDILRRDKDGYYWVVDRRKDMYISGGENVYPAEIENILAALDGMTECAVVGISDKKWGEVGQLFWVASKNSTLTESTLRTYLKQRLAGYKVPKHITRLEELPRNGSGKILKTNLRGFGIEVEK